MAALARVDGDHGQFVYRDAHQNTLSKKSNFPRCLNLACERAAYI